MSLTLLHYFSSKIVTSIKYLKAKDSPRRPLSAAVDSKVG